MAFPALNHVAITVRNIAVSGPWYRNLLGADPILDEHTDAGRAELEYWVTRLGELGIDHGGIVDAPYGSGLSFRDPDGIALEFFAPPG
jgi:catechol 2,3-dioxygenase-like lactoylglutathione lyase family enzyme